MLKQRNVLAILVLVVGGVGTNLFIVEGIPHRILLDTDVDTDDFFALLYLLKLNRAEIELEAITVSANAWTDAGHAVNQIYDILYMMGRDDIPVGVGGEGGILENGTILPNVGGYLPVIEQGHTTAGYCRYRQAIPVGRFGGRLDIDSNFGIRKAFLPQGSRKYSPLRQPNAQQVLIEKISAGPITIFLTGAHTNLGIFLMSNPRLKKNIEHIYVMGGGVRSSNPTGCCPQNASSSCQRKQCGDRGNLFTDYTSNPYAEFNIFGDPFAAYQVFHSGIPVTLVPLDATNSIPISEEFFKAFEENQYTYEAQYCFKSLKMARDTWFDSQFYKSYFMWDSFMSGVAVSIMQNLQDKTGRNEFAEMEYMNITVVTSNEPYGILDGSNPFFDGLKVPRFNLEKGGVHSGHVQTRLQDPFCIVQNGKGQCQDGYTKEVNGSDRVRVLVATRAKPNPNATSELNRAFFKNFLNVLNNPQHAGKFNFTTQFPYYREILYKPEFGLRKLGKPVVFDMDMSAGDFLALFYLLKVPVEMINIKVIPHGSGGLLDSDTLYGLARDLPRSPRRYTAENSVKFGAPRDTDHPELRQPLALEIWESIVETLDPGSKVTILTNGPLTSLASIILSANKASSHIKDVYVVGGHMSSSFMDKGNVLSIDSNKYAEMNLFLDPLAAKTVFDSPLDITLIPLGVQHRVSSYPRVLQMLRQGKKTPEAIFGLSLLSRLHRLQQTHYLYSHMDTFLGEILGAVVLAANESELKPTFQIKPIRVIAEGVQSKDGQTVIDERHGKLVKVLQTLNSAAYYKLFADQMRFEKQSAVIGSFKEQKRIWSMPPINEKPF